ncbi:phage tail assembly chaperone [Sphingomicrobium arenosum]|uniref:phage tail assembly chaperone n=1 Tax=Sphingomicrobium arenosum TaxID=2233861 RepID=UPI002240039F|nr:phage tail assembly chaperone [Sphingomicrobium arenosum]
MTRFTPRAARLFGLAAQQFGWPPDVFWKATPAELASALGLDLEAGGLDGAAVAGLRAMMTEKEVEHGRGT